MDILPNEVESVKIIGQLFGDDVKLVKTVGGFNIAVGKKKKTERKAEALAAGSHPAIVSHQLSKEYGADFQPAIFKSEHDRLEEVENKTEHLTRENIEKGIELYTLVKDKKIDFIVYKHGLTLSKYETEIVQDSLVLKSYFSNKELFNPEKSISEAVSKAMQDKMYQFNLTKIEKGWKF